MKAKEQLGKGIKHTFISYDNACPMAEAKCTVSGWMGVSLASTEVLWWHAEKDVDAVRDEEGEREMAVFLPMGAYSFPCLPPSLSYHLPRRNLSQGQP